MHASPGSGARDHADVPHIIEFGGGAGRFAYLFVRHLRELAPRLRFTYVLTDFSTERVASWADHPKYGPLIEEGLIDFAVLDADRLGPLELVVSGRTLSPGSLRGPVVGIANYVFDTLRHDSFAIRGGELMETRVVHAGRRRSARRRDRRPAWSGRPCRAGRFRTTSLPSSTFTATPWTTPRCWCRWEGWDAWNSWPRSRRGRPVRSSPTRGTAPRWSCAPTMRRRWCFTATRSRLMVNFDFLARYVRQRGGVAILPREPARSLVVAAFVQGDLDDPAQFESSVQDQLVDTGPDNYFTLRPLLSGGTGLSIETMLASLRFSRFDPALLIELLHGLLEVLPTVPDSMRSEIERVLVRVWDNYFPIGEPIDMALCVGLGFSAMERFPQAVDFLELSVKEHPESAAAAFTMAVARRGMRDLGAAMEWVAKALELEPGLSEARALRAVLTEELAAGSVR